MCFVKNGHHLSYEFCVTRKEMEDLHRGRVNKQRASRVKALRENLNSAMQFITGMDCCRYYVCINSPMAKSFLIKVEFVDPRIGSRLTMSMKKKSQWLTGFNLILYSNLYALSFRLNNVAARRSQLWGSQNVLVVQMRLQVLSLTCIYLFIYFVLGIEP